MAEINLLKNELDSQPGFGFSPGRSRSLMFVVALIILEILIYVGFFVYTKVLENKFTSVDQQAATLQAEIASREEDRQSAVSHQERLNTIGALINAHVYWTQVLKELENYTYKPAVLATLQVEEIDHKFVLTGTIPTYTDLAKMMVGLEQSKYIDKVELKSSQLDQQGTGQIAYNIELTFSPKLLLTND